MQNGNSHNEEGAFCRYKLPGDTHYYVAELGMPSPHMPSVKYFTAQAFDFWKDPQFLYFPILEEKKYRITEVGEWPIVSKLGNYTDSRQTKENFISFVEEARNQIALQGFRKVVAARTLFEVYKQNLNWNQVFCRLAEAYPNSFICMYYSAATGCWITATPELFLQKNGNRIESMSLAGTRKMNESEQEWGAKELDEQALVSTYINEVWKNFGLSNIRAEGPVSLNLQSIQHLKTVFYADLPEELSIEKLAAELHPTPAVGGLPKEISLQFIEEKESFKREMYAGFLGIGEGQNLQTFVQLRTARIYDNGILYFAGAGITQGSDPNKEWVETENKCKILSAFLY